MATVSTLPSPTPPRFQFGVRVGTMCCNRMISYLTLFPSVGSLSTSV